MHQFFFVSAHAMAIRHMRTCAQELCNYQIGRGAPTGFLSGHRSEYVRTRIPHCVVSFAVQCLWATVFALSMLIREQCTTRTWSILTFIHSHSSTLRMYGNVTHRPIAMLWICDNSFSQQQVENSNKQSHFLPLYNSLAVTQSYILIAFCHFD